MNNQKQIVDALRKRGNKVTPQRLVTIEVLMTFREQHFSVEELFQGVKQRNPDVGMSTIYRTVQILEEMDSLPNVILMMALLGTNSASWMKNIGIIT